MKAPGSLLPLRIEDLCFEAGGRRIIDGISLEIAAGARTVILGPNGAGKSVLMRICHGLLAPTSGRAAWNIPQPAGGESHVLEPERQQRGGRPHRALSHSAAWRLR